MNKLQFWATAAAVALTATLSFSACSKDNPAGNGNNQTENPGNDPNTGVPAEGTRLVDKIVEVRETESNYNNEVRTEHVTVSDIFSYDSKGRVVRVSRETEGKEFVNSYAISYGANSITVTTEEVYVYEDESHASIRGRHASRTVATPGTRTKPKPGDLVKHVNTIIYNLNSEGLIISTGAETSQDYINDELVEPISNIVHSGSDTYTYTNGYLASCDYETRNESHFEDGSKNIFESDGTRTFNWTEGNLTSIVDICTQTTTYGNEEPRSMQTEYITTYHYSAKVNPAKVNLDISTMIDGGYDVLGALNFFGKRSANLIDNYVNTHGDGNNGSPHSYTWETDEDGYVTKCVEEYEDSYSSEKSTYTVSYKK
jgi:hypothetical protein